MNISEKALNNKKSELLDLYKTLQEQMYEVEVEIRVIDKFLETSEEIKTTTTAKTSDEKHEYVPVKDTVIHILQAKKSANVDGIIEEAKKENIDLNKGSVSATLSRLKKSGEVKYDDKKNMYQLGKRAA